MHHKQRSKLYYVFLTCVSKAQAVQIVNQLEFYESVHGLRWMVDRMKSYTRVLLGFDSPTVRCIAPRVIKGPMAPFCRNALSSRRELRRSLNVLKIVNIFYAEVEDKDYVEHAQSLNEIPLKSLEYIPARAVKATPVKRGPYLGSLASFEELWACSNLVFKHYEAFKELPVYPRVRYLTKEVKDIVGHCVCLTKDGALKKRFVYAPFTTLQYVLEPIYWVLKGITDNCPEMFHNNQERGKERVAELMHEQYCVSVDLKSATDYIPSEPQFTLLRDLFPHLGPLIDLAQDVSYGRWKTPVPDVYVRHTVGQPMGLKFSFLLFSYYLYRLIKEEYPSGNFAIVGDDLVLPAGGQGFITDLGLTVSQDKCMFGDFNEFCGTVFDYQGDLDVKRIKSLKDPLSLVSRLGTKILPLFPKPIREAVSRVAQLPPPVGLGFKPKAVSRLSPEAVLALYEDQTPDYKLLVPFPTARKAYRQDVRMLFSNPQKFLTMTSQERRRLEKYYKLVKAQDFVRARSLLCVIEGYNKAGTGLGLLETIYGIPAGWQSTLEYPMAEPHPFVTHNYNYFTEHLLMLNDVVKVFLSSAVVLASSCTMDPMVDHLSNRDQNPLSCYTDELSWDSFHEEPRVTTHLDIDSNQRCRPR